MPPYDDPLGEIRFLCGKHDSAIESLCRQHAEMNKKLDVLISRSERWEGGKGALILAGSLGGGIAVALGKLWSLLKGL